eukprot:821799-Pleurochrysis_carterae.AAC.1
MSLIEIIAKELAENERVDRTLVCAAALHALLSTLRQYERALLRTRTHARTCAPHGCGSPQTSEHVLIYTPRNSHTCERKRKRKRTLIP